MDSIDDHLTQASSRMLAANSFYAAGKWAEAAIHMSYAKLEFFSAYRMDDTHAGLLQIQESYQTLYSQLIQKKNVTLEPLFMNE